MSGLDALVFCGGIGENSARIRRTICKDLHWLGLDLDELAQRLRRNADLHRCSPAKIFVVKTDEEAMIAKHTQEIYYRS